MELIVKVLEAYTVAKELAHAFGTVSDWVIKSINDWSRKSSNATIEAVVGKLGKATPAEIRAAAAKTFAGKPVDLSDQKQREELIDILINLTRNVRTRNTMGMMRSSYLRSERLLDMLLSDVEPVRRWSEPVTKGNPWVLQRFLGMGSFGEVWMARNPHYPTPHAFKFFTRPGSGEWVRRECHNLSALLNRIGDHPNIVKFINVQVDHCAHPFLELEYLEGGSLEEWIVEDPSKREALDKREIIRQIVKGLAAAHGQDIAHRDMKPANILLSKGPDYRVKIADFGLARVATSPRDGAPAMASLAGLVGTAMYLPPESQQRGIRRSPAQDDVFAVGVIWYQLAVDAIERPPYDFADRLKAKWVPDHVIGLIVQCLAHPDRRFPNAQSLQLAVEKLGPVTEIPLPKVPPTPGTPDVEHIGYEYLISLTH